MEKTRSLQLAEFLPYQLSIASNTVSDVIANTYRALYRLSIPEWRLIAILAERDGLSQFGLGAATRMDKVTVSRAAVGLVDRGLVKRALNPEDKRSNLLSLSAEGRALYEQVAPRALAFEDAILQGFSGDEISCLKEMLQRLQEAALQLV